MTFGQEQALQKANCIQQARDIVLRHGWHSTCYQTLHSGFRHRFFSDLDAMVAYVVAGGRRVVAGPPICPAHHLAEVVARFDHDSYLPAVYFGAGSRFRERAALGSGTAVCVGAQPVWDPADWEDRVLGSASLRYQFRRAERKGVTVREWKGDTGTDLSEVVEGWLTGRGMPPMHFLGRASDPNRDSDRRYFVAEVGCRPVAFLGLSPIPSRNGWVTENFPRVVGAPNGTMELLMHESVKLLASEGAGYFTMGLVPLSEHGPMSENPAWLGRMLNWGRYAGAPLFSVDGLDAFKSKFRPQGWEPVYALTPGRRFGIQDLLAIGQAFTGGRLPQFLAQSVQRAIASVKCESYLGT